MENQIQLSEGQIKTYKLIAKTDLESAERYKHQCFHPFDSRKESKQDNISTEESKECNLINCRKRYYKNPNETIKTYHNRKYCSRQCAGKARIIKDEIRICSLDNCNNSYKRNPKESTRIFQQRKYCCYKCAAKGRRKNNQRKIVS